MSRRIREARNSSAGVGSVAGIAFVLVWLLAAVPAGAQEVIELPAEDRWLEPEIEEVYRVGSLSGEEWEQFGNVRMVGFDGAGQLYIFDSQADRIFVVSPNGEFVRAFGRPGDGPGEFRSPNGLAVMRDGRVVIADIGHRAYHLFDAAGEFERMVRMPSELGILRLTELLPDPGGRAIFSAVGGQALGLVLGGSVRTAPHTTRPVERVMLTARVATKDTVAEGWLPDGDPASWPVGDRRTLDLPSQKVFGPPMLAGVLPDGSVAFSDSSAYVVKIARPEEGVWRILKRPLRPIPVTDRVIEAEKQRRLNASGGGSVLNGVRESPQGSRRRALERIEELVFFERTRRSAGPLSRAFEPSEQTSISNTHFTCAPGRIYCEPADHRPYMVGARYDPLVQYEKFVSTEPRCDASVLRCRQYRVGAGLTAVHLHTADVS